MTEEDLAAQLREGLRQRQNDALFLPDREGPLDKPKPWQSPRDKPIECSTGKRRFPTWRAASDRLAEIKTRVQEGRPTGMYTVMYVAPRCTKCRGFHVTSKIPRQTRDTTKRNPRPNGG